MAADERATLVSPRQFARLQEGILAATNAGHGPRRATAWGIIYAGIKIDPESFGEYKIVVDHATAIRASITTDEEE